jgi:hypothetical protein
MKCTHEAFITLPVTLLGALITLVQAIVQLGLFLESISTSSSYRGTLEDGLTSKKTQGPFASDRNHGSG